MKRFDYYQPQSLKEAFEWMEKSKGSACYIAGGTDLMVRIKQKAIEPDALISLRGVEELAGIRHNGGLTLGGATPFKDIERDGEIARKYRALSQAVRVLANPQIRNVATIGGNLSNAAPSADSVPSLLVMEAEAFIQGPGGNRSVPIEEFFKGPGSHCMDKTELLSEIHIPQLSEGVKTAFLKAGRVKQDLAVANAAAMVEMDGKKCRKCRLAAGAVAPVPLRLKGAERLAEDQEITEELLDKIAGEVEKEVQPITDVRCTEEYRRSVTGVLIKRAILQATET